MLCWLIVGLVVTGAMILLLACESDGDGWIEWRHPPEDDDDGIREDDEHE